MPANYVLLERIELNASAASVTFSNIPQSGYTDLKVVMSGRTTTNPYSEQAMFYGIGFNGQGNLTNVTGKILIGNGTSAFSLNTPADGNVVGYMSSSGATANTFGNAEIYIPNYTSSSNKSFYIDSTSESNATSSVASLFAGLWSQTAAITSVTLTPRTDNWAQYSTFSLYGLAAVGTTPVIAPKATGGNITTDGTYWIHTFNTTGAFTPQTALSCDYLVIAGGGGGGGDTSNQYGGGGGAGGYRTSAGTSGGGASAESALTLALNTSYTVTVGAGGTAGSSSGNAGGNGSNSVFATITSTGGGGGGGGAGTQGQVGGSGGGAGEDGTYPRWGAGTSNQGYRGGGEGSYPYHGGGGGAGGVGGDANAGTSYSNAPGGIGVASSITGSSVTRAVGGVGAKTGGSSAGTANTGNGGDGTNNGNSNAEGAAGGSGIVIIRYAI